MLEGKLKKSIAGLGLIVSLSACGKGGCETSSPCLNYTPPAQGAGYFDEARNKTNADGCRDGCYKEDPNKSCCWCPD